MFRPIHYRSSTHLQRLVNDVLDLAKIEARKIDLDTRPFHLPGLISEVCAMMQTRADAKELSFSRQIMPFSQAVLGDEIRLRQVLANLLGNAVKFTRRGGVTLIVEHSSEKKDHIRFTVNDTGIGIASDSLKTIFSSFEQVGEKSLKAKGTGLGLALVKEVADWHGASIEVDTQVGEGSCFTVLFPASGEYK